MNINDVKDSDLGITGEDKLDQIFRRQLELMSKYHGIEKRNHLLIVSDVPVNLHDSLGQYRLKDFAWRITEELGEAFEALRIHPGMPDHFKEEIADALHFLVEFTILSGMQPKRLFPHSNDDKLDAIFAVSITGGRHAMVNYTTLLPAMAVVIESLAITCNCLKNKPWKTTQMMTDIEYFYRCLSNTWMAFTSLCWKAHIDAYELFNLYFRKSEVNKFRQRTNY